MRRIIRHRNGERKGLFVTDARVVADAERGSQGTKMNVATKQVFEGQPLPAGYDLAALLEYRNEEVLFSFCESFAVERDEAERIFVEMLKFLWLCHTENDRTMRTIDAPIVIIDEMWHTFVLFTRDYHEFSLKYFGKYIHHQPTTSGEKQEERSLTPELRQKAREEQRARYSRIFDKLGRETFVRWFHEFPERYSKHQILALRKK
jgi:hypothetical protein